MIRGRNSYLDITQRERERERQREIVFSVRYGLRLKKQLGVEQRHNQLKTIIIYSQELFFSLSLSY